MITKSNKNIVCIKDIPSNLIEEAILILKPNVSKDEKTNDVKPKSREIILKEAEEIIKEYSSTAQIEKDAAILERRRKTLEAKKKIKQNLGMLLCGIFAILVILILLT
jgi:predicted nucleic acid-binding Zn ribbon protein